MCRVIGGGCEDDLFTAMKFGQKGTYKLFGLITSHNTEGSELILWHIERCGKSEEARGIMKEDLAGGRLSSGDFGENAAWWRILVVLSS